MIRRMDDFQRQIEMVALIESRPGHYSEYDLAEKMCISLATLRRDMKALRDMGIPIRSRKRVCTVDLNLDDLNFLITTIFAFGQQERIRNLPAIRRKMKQQTLMFFVETVKSIGERRLMEIDYPSRNQKSPYWRTIVPLMFYNAGKSHYLIALHEQIPKIFTIEKIHAFRVLNEKASLKQIPPVSELFRHAWGSFTGGEVSEVQLLFHEHLADYVSEKFWVEDQTIKKTEHGILVTMQVRLSNEFLAWLMGWGDAVRVLEPPILIEHLKEKTSAILKLYTKPTTPKE